MSKRIRHTPEERLAWQREYQRKYYHTHREEAKAYQREYNKRSQAKNPRKKDTTNADEARKAVGKVRNYTQSQLLHEINPRRLCKKIQDILDGTRGIIT